MSEPDSTAPWWRQWLDRGHLEATPWHRGFAADGRKTHGSTYRVYRESMEEAVFFEDGLLTFRLSNLMESGCRKKILLEVRLTREDARHIGAAMVQYGDENSRP